MTAGGARGSHRDAGRGLPAPPIPRHLQAPPETCRKDSPQMFPDDDDDVKRPFNLPIALAIVMLLAIGCWLALWILLDLALWTFGD